MVATAGSGWRLAPCLVALFQEADRINPNRDTGSDGSIGDPAHAARVSDHNPADGWVCAGDIDENGVDVDLLRAHLVAGQDPRVKYLIRNGTIWKAYANRGLPAWAPQVYTGVNAHDKHLHISVWNTADARNDTSPWWPEEDDMSEALDKLQAIELRIIALADDIPDNLADQLAEIRRNLRKTAEAAGVPAGEIET